MLDDASDLVAFGAAPRRAAHHSGGSIAQSPRLNQGRPARLEASCLQTEHTEQTCIIVVEVGKETGIIVGTVSEMLDIKGENIEPPPAMDGSVDTTFILGMGKVGEEVKIPLD